MKMSTPVLVMAALLLSTAALAGENGKKVLMILSNGAAMGDTMAKNNLWEYAEPHHVFIMHGYTVDFVSPQGGQVPFSLDADETDPPGMVSYTIKYEGFRAKADRTLKPEQIDADEYVAAFIGGGTASLFDAAQDQRLLAIVATIYQRGGIVGACGHGPGSLADVKLANGEYLVKAKRVTGFPNSSERNSKRTKGGTLLPFRVEDRLRARGAMFVTKADLADKHEPVIDQRIVTTMFLPSSAIVAQEMVNLLQHTQPAAGH
ncbi:MAG: type 1 glutamine amidotransferase domain-containing protein [Pseudomonadota bacterium]|nr:type 1 glutamine amidotransferase domain-containing protein [Pseudomonadota bacterium]